MTTTLSKYEITTLVQYEWGRSQKTSRSDESDIATMAGGNINRTDTLTC